MRIKVFDFLSIFVSEYKISQLILLGGPCGTLLLLRPILYFIFSRKRDLSEYATVDSSAMVFVIYAFLGFFFAIREFNSGRFGLGKHMIKNSGLVIFVFYTILGFVSMFWSINYTLTGFRAFECLGMLLMIVMTLDRLFSYRKLSIIIEWSMLWVTEECVISIIKTLVWTSNVGEILQTNQMFAPFFVFLILLRNKRRISDWLVGAFSIFSMSTVAYIGMALGLTGTARGNFKLKMLSILIVIGIGIGMLTLGPEQFLKDTIFFDKEEISLEKTSGRDHFMEAAVECIQENPMGLGFFAGEPYYLYERSANGINAHNAIFSGMIGCGYLGGILMALFLVVMLFNARSNYIHPRYRAALFSCFCVAIVECMGNPSVGSRVYGAWIGEMYVFCLISAFYCYGKYYKNIEDI